MEQTSLAPHSQPKEFLQPQGFLSLAKNVGIKDDTLDLTVIYSTARARAAAVFTRNRFPGAPVIVGRKRLDAPTLGAVVVNNKVANVCAPGGVEAAERICAEAARLWQTRKESAACCISNESRARM